MTDFPTDRIVAVLGGTGPQGRGLARRFAAAGIPVVLGSRDADRAAALATELAEATGGTVSGADNATAADQGDVVVVAVPWDGHRDLLTTLAPQLAGKVVVDCVNPLGFDKQGAYALPVEEGSAAEQARELLPAATVVAAFHHVSAVLLEDPEVTDVDTDVMVLGDDRDATDLVQALASSIPGVRGVYAGRLRNAHQVEALTANLISVNRRYKGHAGVRVTGLPGVTGTVTDPFSVRPREASDLPALVEVLAAQQPASRYPLRWPLPFPVEDFVVRDVDLVAWTALLDGRPVGHVAAQRAADEAMQPLWQAGHSRPADQLGVLGSLFVDPAVRGRGLGRLLHDTAVGWLRGQDLGPCLDVVPIHAPAQVMYAAAGWREVGRARPPWLPDGQPDVVAMVLPLVSERA